MRMRRKQKVFQSPVWRISRRELEERGYRIERIDCTAKEMDMKWLDELEDMVFPKDPSL